MFWTIDYTPKTYNEILSNTYFFHKTISRKMITYLNVEEKDKLFSHPSICFLGHSCVGKWTMAHLFLEYLFKEGIYTIRKKRLQIDKGNTYEINASSYHCEFNESIFLNCKSSLFLKIIESLGESRHICNSDIPYYVLCKNIHLWTKDYHTIIKHATEKYPDTLRFIITSQRDISTFRQLFTTIRIPKPKEEQILEFIRMIFQKNQYEYTSQIESKIKQKMKNSVDNDIRSILLWSQEKLVSGTWTNTKKQKRVELKHVVSALFSSKSLENLLQIRNMLIECISFSKIEKLPCYLTKQISKHPTLTNEQKRNCISIIAKYDSRMKLHHRNHIHYEAMLYELFYHIHKK